MRLGCVNKYCRWNVEKITAKARRTQIQIKFLFHREGVLTCTCRPHPFARHHISHQISPTNVRYRVMPCDPTTPLRPLAPHPLALPRRAARTPRSSRGRWQVCVLCGAGVGCYTCTPAPLRFGDCDCGRCRGSLPTRRVEFILLLSPSP